MNPGGRKSLVCQHGKLLEGKYKTPPTGYDGEIEITWETPIGFDYDLDLDARIRLENIGSDRVIVENAIVEQKAGAQ